MISADIAEPALRMPPVAIAAAKAAARANLVMCFPLEWNYQHRPSKTHATFVKNRFFNSLARNLRREHKPIQGICKKSRHLIRFGLQPKQGRIMNSRVLSKSIGTVQKGISGRRNGNRPSC